MKSSPSPLPRIEPRSLYTSIINFSGIGPRCYKPVFPLCSAKIRQEMVLMMQFLDVLADDRMVSYLQQTVESLLFERECYCCSDVFKNRSQRSFCSQIVF